MKPLICNLNETLTYHLEAMYDAEKTLAKALPKFFSKISSPRLKIEMKKYAESSVDKRLKLKRIFSYLLVHAFDRKNKVIEKLLRELNDSQELCAKEVKSIVGTIDMINIVHYKITMYTTAMKLSEKLGIDAVTDLIKDILQLEQSTEVSLSSISLNTLETTK